MRPEEIQGWMSPPELAWLAEQAAKCHTVIELGCWKGRSTLAIAQAVQGKLYCVDHFGGSKGEHGFSGDQWSAHAEAATAAGSASVRMQFLRNMEEVADKYVLIEMTTANAALKLQELLPDGADMVFIDAGHFQPEVEEDIRNYLPLVKPGGLLSGHDIDYPGVRSAVVKLLDGSKCAVGTIWAYRKPQ